MRPNTCSIEKTFIKLVKVSLHVWRICVFIFALFLNLQHVSHNVFWFFVVAHLHLSNTVKLSNEEDFVVVVVVMGHWQYILNVNTILFVPHCMISLCSFMIPVRIQSAEDFICFFSSEERYIYIKNK